MRISDRLANFIIVTVTLVWTINFGAQFFVENYVPDNFINTTFMAIAGGAFALKSRNGGNDGEGPSSREGGKHRGQ